MDEEASGTQIHLPTPLSSQYSQQAFSEAVKENTKDARSKTRKLKLLQASGSVAEHYRGMCFFRFPKLRNLARKCSVPNNLQK
jgi:hypothetical protein